MPLTTQHQNCDDIGAMAMITMLQRVEDPGLPTLDIHLQTKTVIRSSCDAHLAPRHGPAAQSGSPATRQKARAGSIRV